MQRDLALILLLDSEGRFLLQHRDEHAPTYPGYWGLFGGGIKAHETPLEAVKREAFEELRYTPESASPVLTIEYNDDVTGRFGKKFYFSEVCPDKSLLELHEGQAMGWFTLEEAATLKITRTNLSILEKILGVMGVQNA